MVAKNFENGDLIWAKMKGFPPWPGKITIPPKEAKSKKAHHYVLFYDSNNYAWIHDDAIEFHSESLVDKYTKGHKRPPSYLNAVQLIMAASKNKPKTAKAIEKKHEEPSMDLKQKNPKVSKNKAKKNIDQTNDDMEKISGSVQSKNLSKNLKGAQKVLPEIERNSATKRGAWKQESAHDNVSDVTASKKQKSEKLPLKARKSDFIVDKRCKIADFSYNEKNVSDKLTAAAKEDDDSNEKYNIITSDEDNNKAVDFRKEDIDEINYKEVPHSKSKSDKHPRKDKVGDDKTNQVSTSKRHLNLSETEREIESEINTIQQQKSDEVCDPDTIKNATSLTKRKIRSEAATSYDEKISLDNSKKVDVHVTEKQRISLPSDDNQDDDESINLETQRSGNIKSKKEQRQIRIGLAKTTKSRVLSIMRRQKRGREAVSKKDKISEPSAAKKAKTVAGTNWATRDDVSASNIPKKSREFLNLIVSERSESSIPEAIEFPEIDSPEFHKTPESPLLDLDSENKILKLKNIIPTKKKFGFLGLGNMGQRIVKNLLQSGHSVTVWSWTISKCDDLSGAEKALTPFDVIMSCDITFCCLANINASKAVFFGNLGVASGLRAAAITGERKGFVEMTTIDPETSKAIHLEVNLKGGRYLEAQLTGSREQASEGNLLIVAAGDKSLFDDCKSCFVAIGKTSMLVSDQVGVASTYNMIHNMLYGTVYAALAESLALVDSIGLQKEVFINSFMQPKLKTVVHLDKNHTMGKVDCAVNTPLIHVQKSLNAALQLGSSVAQPMHVNAAANEVYKYCKLLKFQDRDLSAIYEAARR